MGEAADVLEALSAAISKGVIPALATIVGVKGSTYRRPGARLLVYPEGDSIGNLSGGCLEGEVEALARDVITDSVPKTVTYDLTADDEAVWGWGLGCNGVIEVFIEPAGAAGQIADAMRAAIEEERSVAVATVIESSTDVPVGARLLLHPDGTTEGSPGTQAAETLLQAARSALRDGATTTVTTDEMRIFVEVLEPPPRLLICGAGHDAIAVHEVVAAMGWRVCVVDDRAELLETGRFPNATDFVNCRPDELTQWTRPDARTYAIVMSHNFLRDRASLGSLLGSDVAYVGMLGPKARLQRLLDALAEDGTQASESDLAKIHGPAGLDVGGEGPDEIAVALAGELLAVHRRRDAGFLRDRGGPIHERNEFKVVAER